MGEVEGGGVVDEAQESFCLGDGERKPFQGALSHPAEDCADTAPTSLSKGMPARGEQALDPNFQRRGVWGGNPRLWPEVC